MIQLLCVLCIAAIYFAGAVYPHWESFVISGIASTILGLVFAVLETRETTDGQDQ